jgi:ubiquinone/menaquinone biosynthesis C-methylase UbiE
MSAMNQTILKTPLPTSTTHIKTTITRYWDQRADVYDHEPAAYRHREVWATILHQALPATEPLNILDVGTGVGFNARLLVQHGHRVIGIDRSMSMLQQAQRHASGVQPSMRLVRGDAEDLPFGAAQFDAVVARNVLWTLPNPEQALAQWRAALRIGGRLVIADGQWNTPDARGLLRRWYERCTKLHSYGRSVLRYPLIYGRVKRALPLFAGVTAPMMASLLRQHGFDDIARWEDQFPDNPYTAAAHTGFFVMSATAV